MTQKSHNGKVIAGAVATLAAILTVLTLLGILPWATKAEVKELKSDIGGRLDQIQRDVSQLRELFIPTRRN